jgi:hypothetical protein
MQKPGRPKSSRVSRAEQLRSTKRAQRERQRRAGISAVQLELPGATAEKLKVARTDATFTQALDAHIDSFVVKVADYPQLSQLAWNRRDTMIPARHAFQLYERNWRFVNAAQLGADERELIDRLARMFGNGVING